MSRPHYHEILEARIKELESEVARLTAEVATLRKVVDLTNEVRGLKRIAEAAAKCGGDVVFSNIRYWNAESELDTMLDKVAAEVTRLTKKGK